MRVAFIRGSKPRIGVTFTDPVTKLTVDPDHLSLFVKDPRRQETEYVYSLAPGGTVVRDAAGEYHADIDMSEMDGDWKCRWEATGAGQSAAEITIHISSQYDGED